MPQRQITHVPAESYKYQSAFMVPTPLADFLMAADGTRVVLVTGVFDVLHQEHLVFLEKAKELGDVLVVCIESDVRVRQIKGPDRPHFSEFERKHHLDELEIADMVVILPDEFSQPLHHQTFISQIQPDFLAVSSHTAHLDKKQAIMSLHGGKVVVVHEHNPDESTSQLLSRSS